MTLAEVAGDTGRQAVESLRGYIYQIYASALAWVSLQDDALLHLEVAEDYSVAVDDLLNARQVKATGRGDHSQHRKCRADDRCTVRSPGSKPGQGRQYPISHDVRGRARKTP